MVVISCLLFVPVWKYKSQIFRKPYILLHAEGKWVILRVDDETISTKTTGIFYASAPKVPEALCFRVVRPVRPDFRPDLRPDFSFTR